MCVSNRGVGYKVEMYFKYIQTRTNLNPSICLCCSLSKNDSSLFIKTAFYPVKTSTLRKLSVCLNLHSVVYRFYKDVSKKSIASCLKSQNLFNYCC